MFACISRGVNVIPMASKWLQNFWLSKNFGREVLFFVLWFLISRFHLWACAISSLSKLALKLTARQFAIALAITLQPCPIFYNFRKWFGLLRAGQTTAGRSNLSASDKTATRGKQLNASGTRSNFKIETGNFKFSGKILTRPFTASCGDIPRRVFSKETLFRLAIPRHRRYQLERGRA